MQRPSKLDGDEEEWSVVDILSRAGTVITSLTALHGFFVVAKFLLRVAGLSLPANLVAMTLLMISLIGFQYMQGEDDKSPLHLFLGEGVAFLKKWMPLWFLPHLVVLPLAPLEQPLLLGTLLVGGLLFTLLGTAGTVVGVEAFTGRDESDGERTRLISPPSSPPMVSAQPPASSPYTPMLQKTAAVISLCGGIVALLLRPRGSKVIASAIAGRAGDYIEEDMLADAVASAVTDPVGSMPPIFRWAELLFFLGATVAAYITCMRLPPKTRQYFHPLLGSTLLIWLVALIYVLCQGGGLGGWKALIGAYLNKNASGMSQWGAGNFFALFLNLVVMSFGISMFEQRHVILKELPKVILGCAFACASGLVATAIFANMIGLNKACRPNVLPRCATIPLALEMNCKLGGDPSAVASICILTALLGALIGKPILDVMRINSPAARGISMGCSAHGLGVAAMLSEPEAFALAAASMTVNGAMGAIAVAIPWVKEAVLNLAGCCP